MAKQLFQKGNQAAKGRRQPLVSKTFSPNAIRKRILSEIHQTGDVNSIIKNIIEFVKSPQTLSEALDVAKYLAPITRKELEGNDEVLFTERDKRLIQDINKLSQKGLLAMSEVMQNSENLKDGVVIEDE